MSKKPFGLAVKALVTDEQQQVLLLRRSAASRHFRHQWDLPGGKVDPGEHLDAALEREVAEETGLAVAAERLAGASEYELPAVRAVTLFLEARVTSGTVRLSDEHDALQWAPRSELARLELAEQLCSFLSQYSRSP